MDALAEIGELIESGRFLPPVVQTFELADVADAHRTGEDGHVHGKLVLLVDPRCRARHSESGPRRPSLARVRPQAYSR